MRRVVYKNLFIPALALALTGCELSRENRPSVLVIAVEGLGFESLSCDTEIPGLESLCDESVRFSHAFTPSTMSQATMASLLTGLYPVDHQVRNNGGDFLSARFKTLAEGALSKNYRTLFVSGGAPIWRKSGLAQGFEVFDDQVDISPGQYYRPSEEVFRITTHWMDQEASNRPFLAVTFLADLQFPQTATRTREGEVRERSRAAQLEEVVESLGELFKNLKSRHRWNNTNIVIVGLNSFAQGENDTEPSPLSLRANSVQVSLFIKPARKERDNVIQWAVDRNVSLVDVGVTMFQWLGLESGPASVSGLQPQSLLSVLNKPEPNWEEDRLILTETAWPDWLEGDGVRLAVRQNQFLYVHDKKPLIFNTLADRNELLPLRAGDPLWNSMNGEVLDVLKKLKVPPFKGMHPNWLEQLEIARGVWRDRKELGVRWYLRKALTDRDWPQVKKLSTALNEPVGAYIASRQLNEATPVPRNACLRLILGHKEDKRVLQSDCEDERALALNAWRSSKNDEDGKAAQERFLRLNMQAGLDQEIGRLNYLNDLRWDVDREFPEVPSLVDYVLSLKEFETFSKKASNFWNSKDARL